MPGTALAIVPGLVCRDARGVPDVMRGEETEIFGIADAGGKVGSLELAVADQLNRVGPLLASDILTAWSGPDGKSQFLALGKVPATATATDPKPATDPARTLLVVSDYEWLVELAALGVIDLGAIRATLTAFNRPGDKRTRAENKGNIKW